jgi:hypothetical protein
MQRVAAPRRTLAATEPSGPTIRLKHRARTHTSTPPVFAQTVDRRAARPSTRTPCAGRRCASPSLSGTRAELARTLAFRDGCGHPERLPARARNGRDAGVGWCLIDRRLGTPAVARSGPRGPARPLPHRVGRRAHERLHAGGRRAPARARDRQAGGVTAARCCRSQRLEPAYGHDDEWADQGRASTGAQRAGIGDGPLTVRSPGPAAVGQDRTLIRERTDRSRLGVGVRFLLRRPPTLRA